MIQDFRRDALATFHGLPVFEFAVAEPEDLGEQGGVPDDLEAWAFRVGSGDYEGPEGQAVWQLFLSSVDTTRIKALTLGAWCPDEAGTGWDEYQAALIAAADRFPALEALFVGDIPVELSEVSWIEQEDPGPLLAAFPNLVEFGVRGTAGVQPLVHERLRELTIQTGGLPPQSVRNIGSSTLPALTGLDLYLGTVHYGGGATAEDLDGVLSGAAFPHLRHLGLRNAEDTDNLAAAVAHAPVVAQLETLDLSLGMLGDAGAAALLAGQPLTHLRRLALQHHFLSDEMISRLWEALPTTEIDVDEQLTERGGDRYIAVTE
ncbi:STM4015 family protein [Catenulispora yoronensis]|uniref:STM4015 family protein n=1 Tax=Catenulispora yoronensis TaxID=450799 RepID=A0ABP5FQ86_9ACTN